MREEVAELYEDAASWGQAVKGDEQFADRAFQKIGEPRIFRRGLTVEAVAREVARRNEIPLERLRSPTHGRREAMARATVAWTGREAGGLSIARAAKYFARDTSSLTRGVERLEETMRIDRGLRKAAEELADSLRPENASLQD